MSSDHHVGQKLQMHPTNGVEPSSIIQIPFTQAKHDLQIHVHEI
jgi:hypothetical protein